MNLLRRMWLVGGAIACALTGGCGTASFHPVWSAAKGVSDDRVVGVWKPATVDEQKQETYTVARAEGGYTVAMKRTGPDGEFSGRYVLRLVKLGPTLFAEFTPAEDVSKRTTEQYGLMFMPMHNIWRLTLDKDAATLHMLDDDWLKAQADKNPASIQLLERPDGSILLISGTETLQKFFERAGVDPEAFKGDGARLVRAEPAAPAPGSRGK
ncbi:MAG: hypothetical protein KIT68_03575 [Phycisphaeraceae bacterium]|nr:hypothetical protein [Phycisphaeraceae bacterium]